MVDLQKRIRLTSDLISTALTCVYNNDVNSTSLVVREDVDPKSYDEVPVGSGLMVTCGPGLAFPDGQTVKVCHYNTTSHIF